MEYHYYLVIKPNLNTYNFSKDIYLSNVNNKL